MPRASISAACRGGRSSRSEPAHVRRLAVCAGFACTARAAVRPIAGRPRSSRGRCGKERFDVRRQITSLESPLLVPAASATGSTVRSRSLAIRMPQANFELIPDAGHVAKRRQAGRARALLRIGPASAHTHRLSPFGCDEEGPPQETASVYRSQPRGGSDAELDHRMPQGYAAIGRTSGPARVSAS